MDAIVSIINFKCPGRGCLYEGCSSKIARHLNGSRNTCCLGMLTWKCPYIEGATIINDGNDDKFKELVLSHLVQESTSSRSAGSTKASRRECCEKSRRFVARTERPEGTNNINDFEAPETFNECVDSVEENEGGANVGYEHLSEMSYSDEDIE